MHIGQKSDFNYLELSITRLDNFLRVLIFENNDSERQTIEFYLSEKKGKKRNQQEEMNFCINKFF